MVSLTTVEYVIGVSSLLIVLVSTIMGLIIISKYFKYKRNIFIMIGLTWIGIVSPWYPSSLSFLSIIFTGEPLSVQLYFILGIALLTPFMFVWLLAFTEILYKDKQLYFLIIYGIIGATFEMFFFYFLINDPSQIGNLTGPVNVEYRTFVLLYVLFLVALLFVTGIIFGFDSLKSDNPEMRLKGKLIIIAFVIYAVAGLTDAIVPLNIFLIVIMRVLSASSSVLFYLGFILPNWVKRFFLK